MKRLIKLAGIIAFVAVIGFVFFACDDGGTKKDSLDGTTWTAIDSGATITVTFNSPNFTVTSTNGGQTIPYASGTYSISGNTVTVNMTITGQTTPQQETGTLSGNSLTFSGMTFTKQ